MQRLLTQILMRKITILVLLFIFSITGLYAQKGTLSGQVRDAKTNETLIGVTVALLSRDHPTTIVTGAITDFDGNYRIMVEEGSYLMRFTFVSYDSVMRFVDVQAGQNLMNNIELTPASISLGTFTVKAKINRSSENVLLMDQKKAAGITQNIGSKELSRKGASDVASGVKKVAGVSMMGSKQLFVRGLGDRYNAAQLNGLPIISPDPTKKIIKLDIFQSDVVKYLSVHKAYSVRNYADYTGALIDIITLDYPEDPFLAFSIGSKYNTNSTGKDFTRIDAEGLRFFGFDVKERQKLTPKKYWIAKKRTQIIEPDFNYASYAYTRDAALPAIDFGVSGGKLFQLNEKRKIGLMFNLSFNNEYETHPDIIQLQVNKQNIKDGDFVAQKYSYNTYFTALANATYEHNKNNSIKYNLLYLNNGEDSYNEKTGTRPDWQSGEKIAIIRNAQYINYRLLSNQVQGHHKFAKKFEADWLAGLMNVDYNVPDRREIVYINETSEDDHTWVYMTLNNGNDTKRVLVEQNSNEINLSLNFKYKFDEEAKKGSVQMGTEARQTKLDYRSYYYGYVFETQSGNLSLPVDIDHPDEYFTSEYLKKVRNNSSDNMGYDGNSSIFAAYADVIYNINEKISMNVGLRLESSKMGVTPDMNVDDGDEIEKEYSNLDFFPAANIKYALNEDMNLRLAASRTVTRPSFYEKSPAYIIPEQGSRQITGNPYTKDDPADDGSYLENSYSSNLEIKWEWFPALGELIAFGAYGKIIDEPIERVSKLKGGTDITYTFQNFPETGIAAGLEFEIRKKFRHLYTGLNAAYIYTHVRVPESYNELNSERQLQGASPYLINADIGYEFIYGLDNKHRTYAAIVYNVTGKRIYSVGISGAGNQYQMPVQSLDFILKNKINNSFSIDLSVKNLLNAKYTIKQDVYENQEMPDEITNKVVVNQFQKGLSIGLSLKYSF